MEGWLREHLICGVHQQKKFRRDTPHLHVLLCAPHILLLVM